MCSYPESVSMNIDFPFLKMENFTMVPCSFSTSFQYVNSFLALMCRLCCRIKGFIEASTSRGLNNITRKGTDFFVGPPRSELARPPRSRWSIDLAQYIERPQFHPYRQA